MFKIYSSSAGSGKTYTLTKEYIRLSLHPDNDSYYRHILAVTFTNAAAAEMKDRILGTLRSFASGSDHPMMGDIVRELFPEVGSSPEAFQEKKKYLENRSSRIFTRILHGYSDFSVMTIDSFMSRLVNSFADELGFPFGFETRLDNDLLSEAIERLLARIGLSGEETLTQLLENYYLEHAREEGSWGALPKQMHNVASDLLNEQNYLAMTRVSDLTLIDWQQIRKQLSRFIKKKESEIRDAATQAADRIATSGLVSSDFYYSSRGIHRYFSDRSQPGSQNLWQAPNSHVNKTIGEGIWASKKITTATETAIDALIPFLTECFERIEGVRESYGDRVVLYKSLVSQLYNLSLLNEIKRESDQLLRQNNQVHISEFNRKIMAIVVRDPVPFIFERLGEKYYHILIDEFQDTSRLQFANLLPLIDNSLSSGYFNLIVGDVKQAIYRFRGGDMELLLKLTAKQSDQISRLFSHENIYLTDRLTQLGRSSELSRLSVNRRSYREITTFNNDFFQHLSTVGHGATQLVSEVYDQYFKQETTSSTPSGGHVQIEFFEKQNSDRNTAYDDDIEHQETSGATDLPDQQGQRTIDLVTTLRDEGHQWRDIAILCRYKKDAAKLATWLEQEGIPLISDDSLLLSNSGYIGLLIGFVRVIYAPANTSQRLEAALQFQRIVLKTPLTGSAVDRIVMMSKKQDLKSFLSFFTDSGIHFDVNEIESLGIYELCEHIVARFGLANDHVETRYLFRFLDEVLKFETTRVSHLGDFLSWWDNTANRLSIAAPSDTMAVRITTIHKSKGLEYPVVILPYADWNVTPKPKNRLWIDLEHMDFEELHTEGKRLLSAGIPLIKNLNETPVKEQYRDEVERVLVENINLTYVAFTRAVRRLYILAELPSVRSGGEPSPSTSVNVWLQSYLMAKEVWHPDQLEYILYRGVAVPATFHPESPGTFTLSSPGGSRKATTLSLKKNADKIFNTDNFERKNDLAQRLRQILIQAPSSGDFHEIIRKNTHSGLLRPEEYNGITKKISRLMTRPVLNEAYDPYAINVGSEIILKGGEILEADRFVLTKNGTYLLLLFDSTHAGSIKMKRLLRAGLQSGLKEIKGLLVDLETEEITEFFG